MPETALLSASWILFFFVINLSLKALLGGRLNLFRNFLLHVSFKLLFFGKLDVFGLRSQGCRCLLSVLNSEDDGVCLCRLRELSFEDDGIHAVHARGAHNTQHQQQLTTALGYETQQQQLTT